MVASQTKKRLFLAVGLMIILVSGLLWYAGSLLKSTRTARPDYHQADFKTLALQTQTAVVTNRIAASTPGDIQNAESTPPAAVRRKLTQPVTAAGKIAASTPGDNLLAESRLPAVVRKKLPQMMPAPLAQEGPQAPAPAPEVEAAKPIEEKTVAAAPPEPQPVAAAPAPALKPSRPAAHPAPAPQSQPISPPVAAAPTTAPEPSRSAPPPAPAPQPQPMSPRVETAVTAPKTPPMQPEPKAPSIKPPAAKASSTHPFSLLLSSCREKENAVATIHYFRNEGVAPYIAEIEIAGRGKWWRTLSGSYRTLQTALQAKKSLRLPDAIVVKTPYANLVGEFSSEIEASEQSTRLRQNGFFPYMIHEPGQPVLLLVGAFPDRQAAEQSQEELYAQGIVSQVVLR